MSYHHQNPNAYPYTPQSGVASNGNGNGNNANGAPTMMSVALPTAPVSVTGYPPYTQSYGHADIHSSVARPTPTSGSDTFRSQSQPSTTPLAVSSYHGSMISSGVMGHAYGSGGSPSMEQSALLTHPLYRSVPQHTIAPYSTIGIDGIGAGGHTNSSTSGYHPSSHYQHALTGYVHSGQPSAATPTPSVPPPAVLTVATPVQQPTSTLGHVATTTTIAAAPLSIPTSSSFSSVSETLVDEPSPYQCPICNRYWQDPMVSSTCRHIFCNDCFPRSTHCPRCRSPIDYRAALSLSDTDAELFMRYRNWIERLVQCDTCKMHIPNGKKREHEQKECQEAFVDCVRVEGRTDGCRQKVLRRSLNDHIDNLCDQRLVTCAIGVCSSRIPLASRHDHETKATNFHIRALSDKVMTLTQQNQSLLATVDYLMRKNEALCTLMINDLEWRRTISPVVTTIAQLPAIGVSATGVNQPWPENAYAITNENIPPSLLPTTTNGAETKDAAVSAVVTPPAATVTTSTPRRTSFSTAVTNTTSGTTTTTAPPSNTSTGAPSIVSAAVTTPVPNEPSINSVLGANAVISTSSFPSPHSQRMHDATILTDAKIGGPSQNLSGALLYDIICFGGVHAISTSDRKAIGSSQRLAGGIWQTIPAMPTPRGWCSAARLDNRIYVTGGSIVGGNRLGVVECFDLSTHEWLMITAPGSSTPTSACASLLTARDEHVTLAHGGRIWCMGGVPTGASQALTSMEAYDVTRNQWEYKAPMSVGRGYAAGVYHDGAFYVFGGKPSLGVSKALTSAERYDPNTNQWSRIAPPLTARSAHRAIVVEGRIILLGGQVSSDDGKTVTAVDSGEEYDPRTDTWSILPWRLPLPCANFAIHYNDQDGSLVIAGGWPIARSSAAYRRDGQTGAWSLLPPLRYANYEAAFV